MQKNEKYKIFKNKCKIKTFIKGKKEKLFIRHNKTSNMSYQTREFHKFF